MLAASSLAHQSHLRSHRKPFFFKCHSISTALFIKDIYLGVPESSEHLQTISNLAQRLDTCSCSSSIPPGRRCQQKDLISQTVSRDPRGQSCRIWSHCYLHYWHCLACLGLCSIATGSRGGVPPNKAAFCPSRRAQLSIRLMPLVTSRWQ